MYVDGRLSIEIIIRNDRNKYVMYKAYFILIHNVLVVAKQKQKNARGEKNQNEITL